MTAGSSPPCLQMKDCSPFYSELYSETVKDAVSQFSFSEIETKVSVEIQYKGTVFKKGQLFVIRNDETVEFGELLLMFVTEERVHLLTRVFIADFLPEYHLYYLKNTSEKAHCLNIENLLDFYPLTYMLQGCRVVPLKHSVVSH